MRSLFESEESTILERNYAITAANREMSFFVATRETRHPQDMAMIVKAVKPARSLSIKSISVMFFRKSARAEYYWQIIDNKAELSRENFLLRHLSSKQSSSY